MEEKKEPIKIKLSTAIMLIIIIILIMGIFVYYNIFKNKDGRIIEEKSNNHINSVVESQIEMQNGNNIASNENKVSNEVNETKQIDVNSEIVKKLYNYVVKDNECVEEIAYQNQKVTIDNLNNKAKLMTIFENLDNSKADSTEKEDIITYYHFKKATVEKKAKEIFGSEDSIEHETLGVLLGKEIKYVNGEYIKSEYPGGGGYPWEASIEYLVKAEQTNQEIYLYDKYVHIVTTDSEAISNGDDEKSSIYNASDKKIALATEINLSKSGIYEGIIETWDTTERDKKMISNIEKVTNKPVNTFKHTFKKNTEGDYYWVSTEIVQE